MTAKKKPARDEDKIGEDGVSVAHTITTPAEAPRRGEPKSKKPRPISANPGAALALVHRARRRS